MQIKRYKVQKFRYKLVEFWVAGEQPIVLIWMVGVHLHLVQF